MRRFLPALLLFIATGLSAPALAQDVVPDPGIQDSEDHAEAATPLTEETLDGLFVRLAASEDEEEAKAVEFEIIKRFHQSGSDTTDLLMSWVSKAMDEEKLPLALDVLDRVVIIQPDYAEAWNKRATVNYMIGEFGRSIADIEKTLALEPRHFGALSGLGLILKELGEDDRALEAFEEALRIHPYLDNAKTMVKRLKDEMKNREI